MTSITRRERRLQGIGRVRSKPIDAVTVLSVYVVIMMAVPSLARFPPAGSIGAPATMLAILIFVWWLWEQAHRHVPGPDNPQWVRRCAIILLVVMLAVYGFAALRPLPFDEVTPAASGFLQFLALIGLALTATDGIPSQFRLDVLIGRMTAAGGWVGMLALFQFFTHRLWIDHLLPPFLSMDAAVGSLASRGDFSRPSGTATHPLEFGAVIAMLIPLAVTHARLGARRPARAWLCVAILGLGAMVSLSRSAIICTALAMLVLVWYWPLRDKLRALALCIVALCIVVLLIPGLVGTVRGLFLVSGDDASVQSRTDSYAYVIQMFERFPWFGKGYGTFLPRYWILDNGYLQFLISAGAMGLGAFLLLLTAALWSALTTARQARNRTERELSQAICASTIAGASAVAFFDLFSFPQAAGLLFLLVGLCGASYRLQRTQDFEGVRIS